MPSNEKRYSSLEQALLSLKSSRTNAAWLNDLEEAVASLSKSTDKSDFGLYYYESCKELLCRAVLENSPSRADAELVLMALRLLAEYQQQTITPRRLAYADSLVKAGEYCGSPDSIKKKMPVLEDEAIIDICNRIEEKKARGEGDYSIKVLMDNYDLPHQTVFTGTKLALAYDRHPEEKKQPVPAKSRSQNNGREEVLQEIRQCIRKYKEENPKVSERAIQIADLLTPNEAFSLIKIIPAIIISDGGWYWFISGFSSNLLSEKKDIVEFEDSILNNWLINRSDIRALQQCGVLYFDKQHIWETKDMGSVITNPNREICITLAMPKYSSFTIECYQLTKAAKEIISSLSVKSDNTYLCTYAQQLNAWHSSQVTARIYKTICFPNGEYRFGEQINEESNSIYSSPELREAKLQFYNKFRFYPMGLLENYRNGVFQLSGEEMAAIKALEVPDSSYKA